MVKEKDKVGLKEIVAYEKTQMLPLNFTVSYILTPIYAVVCFLLIGAFAVLMEVDDEKYLVHGLLCLGAMVVISIAFLSCVPFVRKKAIKTELERYDFDTSEEESLEIYDFSTEEFSLKFDKYGMYVNDELFYYNHLNKNVVIFFFNACIQSKKTRQSLNGCRIFLILFYQRCYTLYISRYFSR